VTAVMPPRDLTFLPQEVQRTARRITDGREVMWPRGEAPSAIEALATAGRIVLGLDLRRYDSDAAFVEAAWSSFEPSSAPDSFNVEAARRTAMDGLQRADGGNWEQYDWVVITWKVADSTPLPNGTIRVVRRMNSRMEDLLPVLPGQLDTRMETILRSGVVVLHECLLLRAEVDRQPQPLEHPDMTRFNDRTRYEAFVNHLHLGAPTGDLFESAAGGVAAIKALRRTILAFPAAGQVQLLLAVGFHEIPNVTLRFYRRRPREPWLRDDLEGYLQEAILVEDLG
jgi:hypothetical protein